MDCPVCKGAMVVLELQDVEVDHCFGCSGIWLDAGELELLIDDAQRSMELLESFEIDKKCPEAKRKCPICYKKMEKVVIGKKTMVHMNQKLQFLQLQVYLLNLIEQLLSLKVIKK